MRENQGFRFIFWFEGPEDEVYVCEILATNKVQRRGLQYHSNLKGKVESRIFHRLSVPSEPKIESIRRHPESDVRSSVEHYNNGFQWRGFFVIV